MSTPQARKSAIIAEVDAMTGLVPAGFRRIAGMGFHERLEAARKSSRMSFQAIGDRLGRSREAPRAWCRGESQPTADDVIKLAELLGVDAGWLLTARSPSLTGPESQAVEIVRALGLDAAEVIRRLSTPAPAPPASLPVPPRPGDAFPAQPEPGASGFRGLRSLVSLLSRPPLINLRPARILVRGRLAA